VSVLAEVADAPRVVRGRTGEVQIPVTVPSSLLIVLAVLRPCFTAPSFTTMAALVTGVLSGNGPRTVTGMWQAAGLAGRAHWSRAHRFFSRAVWDLDLVGLALARVVVARFVPRGAAVTLAVDDTLYHRYGKKVHDAKYQHDGSAIGRDGIGRGNCFVIIGIVVTVPFLARQVCLPVLFRLHIPNTSISKTEQARTMVDLFAQALPERVVHIVGDALYRGSAWRGLPARVTFTTRLAANAVLYGPQPPRTGKRGHPTWKGERLGTAAEMAVGATWTRARVTRYGVNEDVDLAVIACLWWGSLHRTPIRVVLVRDLDETHPYTLALATTDLTTSGEHLVARPDRDNAGLHRRSRAARRDRGRCPPPDRRQRGDGLVTTHVTGKAAPRSTRERLLASADELFYSEGVHTVGIDRVEHAGVAKASLYRLFGSKEELVAAYLGARHERTLAELRTVTGRFSDPRDGILAVFDTQGRWLRRRAYRGCAFARASAAPR
jgi:hypothetical protein